MSEKKSRSPVHVLKKRKNLVMLALIVGWVALIWIITMVKIQNGG